MSRISGPAMNPSHPPRFYELDPWTFENLCRDLLAEEPTVATCYLHGQRGEGDMGVDLRALRRDEDGLEVGQCKCYRELQSHQIRKAADDFFNHIDYWLARSVRRFILIVACDLISLKLQEAIDAATKRFRAHGIAFEAWDARILQQKLAAHRKIVYRYVRSRDLVTEICGVEAAQMSLLRSEPRPLSTHLVAEMFREHGFHHPADYSKERLCSAITGSLVHDYQACTVGGETLILDREINLLWQSSGSSVRLDWEAAKSFVAGLNRESFGGYSDWHLPTLEELASLLEPSRNGRGSFISELFDPIQRQCWSADPADRNRLAWNVVFNGGFVNVNRFQYQCFVRAVRHSSGDPA